ncbi:MAG: glycosyltransferase family 4 protein [Candidatus Methylacidiphilaceae bacterium]
MTSRVLPVPPIQGGAVERHWFFLGQEFVRLGHEVVHISRTWPGLPREDWIGGVHHLRVLGSRLAPSRLDILLKDLVYTARVLPKLPAADILVVNTITLPVFARNRRWGVLWVTVGRAPKGQTRFYRHAVRVQAPSKVVAEAIKLEMGKRANVCVLPYSLSQPIGRTHVGLGNGPRERIALFVGRVHPEKGVHLLVEAWSLIAEAARKNWKLVIVGPWEEAVGGGGEAYYRRLEAQGLRLALSIEWKGPVYDPKALQDLYCSASLFVYPSISERGESFGVAPLEAMAHGCPALLSDLACFRDYLKPGENGWVFDHRVHEPAPKLAERLESLFRDEAVLKEAGVRAAVTASGYFPDALASRYLEAFSEAIVEERGQKRN